MIHLRCERCRKLIRKRKVDTENFWARYLPYCSFDCQEWAKLEQADRYLRALKIKQALGVKP